MQETHSSACNDVASQASFNPSSFIMVVSALRSNATSIIEFRGTGFGRPERRSGFGDWLKTKIVEAHGVDIGLLAEKFHVNRQALGAVLNGRSALCANTAIRSRGRSV
ncbi:hypothetical protein [Sphingomonas sp. LaA6.9]|uniref:hypothetical protein n=1 Tax=Sphingomonas sp. LaA6.9 TaxID=2919914 RepID=UPI001F5005A5|nr:hypothetical protein [Sphingomonas sp. LaA6.9]MCJ8158991.1 hypothetical protein [Sphingomonas sp. LaA6.9]